MNKDEIKRTLLEIAKKEIRISYKKPGKPLPATSGKFGGRPAVPRGFEWPYYTGEGREGVKTRPLALMARINLADYDEADEYGVEVDDWNEYEERRKECGDVDDEEGDYTKLLGYPDIIQNPMREECEWTMRKLADPEGTGSPDEEDYDDKEEYEEENDEIREKAKNWTPLFQMGTVELGDDDELMFEDCGHIYYRIRKEDLQNRNFENVRLILQWD